MYTKIVDDKFLEELYKQLKEDGIQKIVAGAVVRLDGGNILLLERNPEEFKGGLVELPSGGVESGETVIDSLVREIKEETGLEVAQIQKYIGHFDYQSSSGKKSRQLNFIVTVNPGQIKINPSEHSQYYVVNPASDDFKGLNISEKTREIIGESLRE